MFNKNFYPTPRCVLDRMGSILQTMKHKGKTELCLITMSFQSQNLSLQLWVLANPDLPLVKREFLICFTGKQTGMSSDSAYKYVGTAQNGLVYHLFEKIN